eukprot:m.60466 g.60466  ORF g.60466 m.60466 type:complete len:112 (-) comp7031_c0_seq1:823-1158(-)
MLRLSQTICTEDKDVIEREFAAAASGVLQRTKGSGRPSPPSAARCPCVLPRDAAGRAWPGGGCRSLAADYPTRTFVRLVEGLQVDELELDGEHWQVQAVADADAGHAIISN